MKACKLAVAVLVVAAVTTTTSSLAHDLFLKPTESVVTPDSDQVIRVMNGTFYESEGGISRDRLADVSIVADGLVSNPPDTAWYDDEDSSYLNYRAGEAGTYVIGVSTRPNMITMLPEDFISYLKHDGVLDTLATFEKENELAEVRERYSKHVRTIVQVGDKTTADYSKQLGYPIEIVLDQNPYELNVGDALSFRVLFKGKPVANQLVRASYEGFDSGTDGPAHAYNLRTDKDGRASFQLSKDALWYMSLIYMQKIDETDADYESNWATITFEVT